ncbi:MAG: DEAD/DEAH box helicase [Myxococcales bacterium]|nr:DEAD/DEAH box helicase [Myxococcales bacterium]
MTFEARKTARHLAEETIEATDGTSPAYLEHTHVVALGLELTADGRFQLHDGTDGLDELAGTDVQLAPSIEVAFGKSELEGLLFLSTRARARAIQPSLEFGVRVIDMVLARLASHISETLNPSDLEPSESELEQLVAEAPMMLGFENIEVEVLERAGRRLARGIVGLLENAGSTANLLANIGGGWDAVGRLCLHLAEHNLTEERPFAFLATWSDHTTPSPTALMQPISVSLEGMRQDPESARKVILQVRKAAEASPLVSELELSGRFYHPLRWTPEEAYTFLAEADALSQVGVLLRLPPAWASHRPNRPAVELRLGEETGFGTRALLDFDATLALGGEKLAPEEQARLLQGKKRLERIRGEWIEVDPESLKATLSTWADRSRASLSEAMRLVTGADSTHGVVVRTGDGFRNLLERLRTATESPASVPRSLKATLRPYQKEGLAWLYTLTSLGLGGCLADDMGLGKTIQVLALVLRLKAEASLDAPCLLVVPASLLGNWRREVEKFAPSLRLNIAHRSGHEPLAEVLDSIDEADVVMTTYGTLPRLEILNTRHWPLVVLDEAQAIKNHDTLQARTVRSLSSDARVALTGTPVENHVGELWSLFAFLEPGLLGKQASFRRFVSNLEERGNYDPLRKMIRPYVLRREKTDKRIIRDLPDKTEIDVHTPLTHTQAALYEEAVRELGDALSNVDGQERRGLVLSFLTRFKQICNHPSHWLSDNEFDPSESGKTQALLDIAERIHEHGEKLLVFTQFRALTEPLATLLEPVFERPGLILHGGTPVKKRAQLVDAFQDTNGPPFFVLSLKAGGTGLNLTAASHVLHFDRWWNPAVEKQATDRAFRIGQHRNVLVHRFVCPGTLEEKIAAMLERKRVVAEQVLAFDGERALTELSDAELLELVRLDLDAALLDEEPS